jgi:hypothetical protein
VSGAEAMGRPASVRPSGSASHLRR